MPAAFQNHNAGDGDYYAEVFLQHVEPLFRAAVSPSLKHDSPAYVELGHSRTTLGSHGPTHCLCFGSEDNHVDANLAEWLRPSNFSSRVGNNPRS
jgi:hypothetical protein